MTRESRLRICWISLVSLLICSCSTVFPNKGANVHVLKPSLFESNSGCKRITLLYFDSLNGVDPGKKYPYNIRSLLASQIRRQLRNIQYFKTTEVQPSSDGSEFHELVINIHEFRVTTQPRTLRTRSLAKDQMVTKTGNARVSLKIFEGLGNECTTTVSEVEEVRQVPGYRHNELPSNSQLYKMLAGKVVVAELLAYISPRKVLTFRAVRTDLLHDAVRDSSILINNRSCESAEKLLNSYLKEHPD